jgi:hypothetical protein
MSITVQSKSIVKANPLLTLAAISGKRSAIYGVKEAHGELTI